jgi:hypothetical protein
MEARCAVCGEKVDLTDAKLHREIPICPLCHSNPRFCGIALAVNRAMYGDVETPLLQRPQRKTVAALGVSDDFRYASILDRLFTYTNTYFHQEPRLDITSVEGTGAFRDLDLIVCSDVVEHTLTSVLIPLQNFHRMLKPGGVAVVSAPTFDMASTIEWYGGAKTINIVQTGTEYSVEWTNLKGDVYVDASPRFHGGPGQVLEMRVMAHRDLVDTAHAAGFKAVTVEFDQGWGYSWPLVRHLSYLPGPIDGRIVVLEKA